MSTVVYANMALLSQPPFSLRLVLCLRIKKTFAQTRTNRSQIIKIILLGSQAQYLARNRTQEVSDIVIAQILLTNYGLYHLRDTKK